MGHNPILSESISFPINPSKSTIDNCTEAVRENADILLLIVGNRYGSIIETGKSITNTEFLVAKSKGIPIFIFIENKTLNALSFWKDNKGGDFSKFVDNIQIFEFIEDIRDNAKLWIFSYDKAQDISHTFKIQLSYLFRESLNIRRKFEDISEETYHQNISNQALKILVDKPMAYEYLFFTQCLLDKTREFERLKSDYKYKIHLNVSHHFDDYREMGNWARKRLDVLQNLVHSLMKLIGDALPFYLSEKGIPSDLKGLYYLSISYSKIFEGAINWAIETESAVVPEDCIAIKQSLAKFSDSVIEEMWNYPSRLMEYFLNLSNKYPEFESGSQPPELNVGIDSEIVAVFTEQLRNLAMK